MQIDCVIILYLWSRLISQAAETLEGYDLCRIYQACVFGEGSPRLSALIVPTSPSAGSEPIAAAIGAANTRLPDGLRIFSEALRRELAGTGIAVTYIAPRAARTGLITRRLAQYAEVAGMAIDKPDHVRSARRK
jgi:NADP-dependent 3-hydroxy acid dehydrogenase YdfG